MTARATANDKTSDIKLTIVPLNEKHIVALRVKDGSFVGRPDEFIAELNERFEEEAFFRMVKYEPRTSADRTARADVDVVYVTALKTGGAAQFFSHDELEK
jgi:hypothetical protein